MRGLQFLLGSTVIFALLYLAIFFSLLQVTLPTGASIVKFIRSDSTRRRNRPFRIGARTSQLHCSDLLSQATAGQALFRDPNNATDGEAVHKRRTVTDPSFWISLHNEKADSVRWAIMKHGFYYEKFLTEYTKSILLDLPLVNYSIPVGLEKRDFAQKSPVDRALFVDVGMNIGWFSLWAKAMGARVVAFEPNPANRLRFCESLRLNGWSEDDGIQMSGVGVGEREETLSLVVMKQNNPGAAQFMGKRKAESLKKWKKGGVYDDIHLTTLDTVAAEEGWLEPGMPPISLLKVDVEGNDPQVFMGAKKVIRSGLVHNIFMEYSCLLGKKEDMNAVATQLEDANYTLEVIGRWNGAPMQGAKAKIVGSTKRGAALQGTLASRLYDFCLDMSKDDRPKKKKAGSQLNLWWRLTR